LPCLSSAALSGSRKERALPAKLTAMTTGAVRSIRRTPSSSAPASTSGRGVPGRLPPAGLSPLRAAQVGGAKRAGLSLVLSPARRGGASRRGEASRASWSVRIWLTRVNLAGLHVEPGSEGSHAHSMHSVSTCTAAEK